MYIYICIYIYISVVPPTQIHGTYSSVGSIIQDATRSSSREVRIRAPFFQDVYFREPSQPKKDKRALLGDLGKINRTLDVES